MLDFFKKIKLNMVEKFCFTQENKKNFYPNHIISAHIKNKKTYVVFKPWGAERVGNMHIYDIYEDKELLNKFSPQEVSLISFLSACEIFLESDEKKVINKMLKTQKALIDLINKK